MRISNERLAQVTELIEGALSGDDKAQGAVKAEVKRAMRTEAEESHSTSDFPTALKAITTAAFLADYDTIQSIYPQYTRQYNVNNLRPQAFYSLAFDASNLPETNGGDPTVIAPGLNGVSGLPRVPELTEFAPISFAASESSFGVAKYGARVNFSFEMLLNDEWGVLETLPNQLAQLARNQEDIVATEVLASTAGPNPIFFNSGNGNLIANNPALSIDSITDAAAAIRGRIFRGNPVTVAKLALMVPPALAAEAQRLLGVTAFQIVDPVNGTYTYANPTSDITLIVNPWLTVIDKSATANTTWYMLPVGSAGIRPAVVFSKIRGREAPELRISNATGDYLGGGAVPGREGSFVNDDIEFRVRHFVGAAGIGFETTAVSKGTNAA